MKEECEHILETIVEPIQADNYGIKVAGLLTGIKEQKAKTIRADATIEERIQDYLGKFHIEYNGVMPHEPFYGDDGEDSGLPPGVRCDTDVKKEIVDQFLTLIQSECNKARVDEWNLISETLHSAGIEAELFLGRTKKDRIAELTQEEK